MTPMHHMRQILLATAALLVAGCSDAPTRSDVRVGEQFPYTPLSSEVLHAVHEPSQQRLTHTEAELRRRGQFALRTVDRVRAAEAEAWQEVVGGRRAVPEGTVTDQEFAQRFVTNRDALATLGKAFFWDMRAGSDGQTACATCHHTAGVDTRAVARESDSIAYRRGSLGVAPRRLDVSEPSGQQLVSLAMEPSIPVGRDALRIDVVGCHDGQAVPGPADRSETCVNAPSVIGATRAFRLFHDGRAAGAFDGVGAFADFETLAGHPVRLGVFSDQTPGEPGGVEELQVQLLDAVAAAQATVPVLNPREMSWIGRTRVHLARKLLDSPVLSLQEVSPNDATLVAMIDLCGGALEPSTRRPTYRCLVQAAFSPSLTSSEPTVLGSSAASWTALNPAVVEANFGLIWGLAIQEYLSRLVDGQSPFDAELARITERREGSVAGWGANERRGIDAFAEYGCIECHALPDTTTRYRAAITGPLFEFEAPLDLVSTDEPNEFMDFHRGRHTPPDGAGITPQTGIEVMLAGSDNVARRLDNPLLARVVSYDIGHYNIGLRDECRQPAEGAGFFTGDDRYEASAFAWRAIVQRHPDWVPVHVNACDSHPIVQRPEDVNTLPEGHPFMLGGSWVLGASANTSLRNVSLTAPYFSVVDLAGEPLESGLSAFVERDLRLQAEIDQSSGVDGAPQKTRLYELLLDCSSNHDPRAQRPLVEAVAMYVQLGQRGIVPFAVDGEAPRRAVAPHIHPEVERLGQSDRLRDDAAYIADFLCALTDPRVARHEGEFCSPAIDLPVVAETGADGSTAPAHMLAIGPRCGGS